MWNTISEISPKNIIILRNIKTFFLFQLSIVALNRGMFSWKYFLLNADKWSVFSRKKHNVPTYFLFYSSSKSLSYSGLFVGFFHVMAFLTYQSILSSNVRSFFFLGIIVLFLCSIYDLFFSWDIQPLSF